MISRHFDGRAGGRTPARLPKTKIIIPDRVAQRAISRWIHDPKTGCKISIYSTASHGYAQIGWQDGRNRFIVTAHRAAWVAHTGEQIPEGMTIDHLCKNRTCINPAHLRMITNFENARRTFGRDWPLGECRHGHPNSELRFWSGRWRCRLCSNKRQRDQRARRKQLLAA